jgi:hypothetical protein
MDPSQSPRLNHQGHEGEAVPLVPKEGLTPEEIRSGGPAPDPDRRRASTTTSIPDVVVAIKQTGPAPAGQWSTHNTAPQPAPITQTASAPAAAATSHELMRQLEALARDFAVVQQSERDSSDQSMGMAQEGSDFSAGLQAGERSIRVSPRPVSPRPVSPRPSDLKNDQFASDSPSIGAPTFHTLASFFMAAPSMVMASLRRLRSESYLKNSNLPFRTLASVAVLIFVAALIGVGVTFGVSTTKSPQPAPVTQAAAPAAAAISLDLVQQLEAVARDLAVTRDSVEQLAAKQEQTAQNIATVAAKQEEMAQNIATLQAVEQDIRQRLSSPPLSEPVPLPPRKKAPTPSAARPASAPRLHASP